ncbi:uncharacterized protein LOC141904351 [Tubulanus polymorphus]|uniref:uncharacterized protein LOC141904351 n=1 Tax=Tubulanus polymorphus TaxID=672921 RepID=UPI003DA569C9
MMCDIENLDHLVPPSLHISLGLVLLFFNLLENKCRKCDNEGLKDRNNELYEKWKSQSAAVCALEAELSDTQIKIDNKIQILDLLKQAQKKGRAVISCQAKICVIRNVPGSPPNDFKECESCEALYHSQCVASFGFQAENFICLECKTGNTLSANKIVKHFTSEVEGLKSKKAVLKSNISIKQSELSETFKAVNASFGPVQHGLNEILKKIGVDRQAYHSQSFVGNHVYKILRMNADVNNPALLCSVLKDHDPDECNKFTKLFQKFSKIASLYSASRFLSATEVEDYCKKVSKFGKFFAENFPNVNITPKLHTLLHHTPAFMKCGVH